MVIRMNKADSRNSDADNIKKVGMMTKSVSALNGHFDEEEVQSSHDSIPKGVSIKNFDSLMEHMTSLNIKFLND